MKRTKRMKNMAALLLALCLAASCALPAFGAEPGFGHFQERTASYTVGQFPDVDESAWYQSYVAAVYELGLMQGDAEGSFRPDDGVTMAETVALAARLHSIYQGNGAAFRQGDPWYQVYVDYCMSNGILTGIPADFSTRARRSEFAALLSHALPANALPPVNEIADGDIPDVPADAAGAQSIYLLYRAGILTGNDMYGTFAPDSEIRRSEVAAILMRMAYRSMRMSVRLVAKPPYPKLEKGEKQGDDFFADAAMLGNSLVDGMMLSSGIPMTYYGKQSGTVSVNRVDELVRKQYGKVYIELGINDIGGSLDVLMNGYRKVVEKIKAAMPDADIYLMAITPVTKARSSQGLFTMEKINDVNGRLYDMAEEMECWYLDCCTPLCDADGYLLEKYAGWDGSPHLDVSGYVAWAELLRTYYAPETE